MTTHRLAIAAALLALAFSSAGAAGSGPTTTAGDPDPTTNADRVVTPGDETTPWAGGRYDWQSVSAEQRALEWPAEEYDSPVWGLAVLGAAVLLLLLTVLGLTMTFRALRSDIRRNRMPPYRQRGPLSSREIA